MPSCRILIVDDNALFLQAVEELLTDLPGVEIAGRAGSGEEALELIGGLALDLVLTDLAMPGIGGLELARRLTQGGPPALVVIMTFSAQPVYEDAAREAGAAALLDKTRLSTDLPPLIGRLLPHCGPKR